MWFFRTSIQLVRRSNYDGNNKWHSIYWRSTAPNEFIKNQASTIDGTQTVENGVLAGPVTIPGYNNSNRDVSSSLMSKINVNQVDTQCGSTLTLGSFR